MEEGRKLKNGEIEELKIEIEKIFTSTDYELVLNALTSLLCDIIPTSAIRFVMEGCLKNPNVKEFKTLNKEKCIKKLADKLNGITEPETEADKNQEKKTNPPEEEEKVPVNSTLKLIGIIVIILLLVFLLSPKNKDLEVEVKGNPIIVTKNSKADEIVTESTISVDNDEVVTTFDKGDGYIQNKSKPHNFPTGVYHRNEVIISISNEGIITDDSDRELDCEKIQGNDGCVVRDDHLNLSYVFLPFTDKKGFESIVIYVYPQKSYRMLIKGIDPGKSIKHFVLKKFV